MEVSAILAVDLPEGVTFEQRPKSSEHLGAGVGATGGRFCAEETAGAKDLS